MLHQYFYNFTKYKDAEVTYCNIFQGYISSLKTKIQKTFEKDAAILITSWVIILISLGSLTPSTFAYRKLQIFISSS